MQLWEEGWALRIRRAWNRFPDRRYGACSVAIRGEKHSVMQAINRQIAHYAYHVGQMVFLAKHLQHGKWRSLSVPRGKSAEFNQKSLSAGKARALRLARSTVWLWRKFSLLDAALTYLLSRRQHLNSCSFMLTRSAPETSTPFGLQTKTLFEGVVSLEFNFAAGAENPLPGQIRGAVESARNLAGCAGESRSPGNGAIRRNLAARNFADGTENSVTQWSRPTNQLLADARRRGQEERPRTRFRLLRLCGRIRSACFSSS